jgi:hypothetical protein
MSNLNKYVNTITRTKLLAFVGMVFLISLTYYSFSNNAIALILSLSFFFIFVYISEKAFGYTAPISLEWSNSEISDSIEQIKTLVQRAQKNITIVSGSLSHKIYEDPTLLEAFYEKEKSILDGSLKIKIYLTGSSIDPKTKSFIELLKKSSIPIIRLKEGCINHFVAIDDRDVRLEERHSIGADHRRAILRFSTPFLVHKVMRLLHKCEQNDVVNTIPLTMRRK